MADDTIRLTYRELADRLGLSLDAAKMKARRAAKAGQWRLVPGNYPNAPVTVELPTAAITPAATHPPQQRPEQSPATPGGNRGDDRDTRLLAALSEAVGLLRPAHDQIERLTAQLMEAKDAHARDRAELVAAEMREMGTKAELERALRDISQLKTQLSGGKAKPFWRRWTEV
ncbi:hypothetical protein [Sphingomonas sp. LHG3443-2]|uniref:hypothetical protein n=1 Tax=Sphingomonas sp. LHG3443-2 TaxID=2804639 RepID=UPI003CF13C76